MAKSHPLRYVPRTRTPNQAVLESLFQRAMDLVTDLLYRRVVPYDQCLIEVGDDSFSIRGY